MQMTFIHPTPVIGGLLLFKKADVTAQRQTRETTIAVKLDPALVSPEHLGIPDLTGCFDDGPTRNEILTRRLQDIFAEGDDRFPGFALTEVDVCVGPASTMVCEHPEHDLVFKLANKTLFRNLQEAHDLGDRWKIQMEIDTARKHARGCPPARWMLHGFGLLTQPPPKPIRCLIGPDVIAKLKRLSIM